MSEHITKKEAISLAFKEIVRLCETLDIHHINQLPGCWEYQLDEQWRIALNGHKEPMECSMGHAVAPFHCYVEWGGFPAGEFHPFGGWIAAGEAANEDAFIAALKKATEHAETAKIVLRPGIANGLEKAPEAEWPAEI